MSLTFPRTDMQAVRIAVQKPFQLLHRQELSREASGVTRGKDLGPALWVTEVTTTVLTNDELIEYLAKLNSLDGVVNAIELYEKRRPYPKNYANGVFNDTGTILSVDNSNLALIRLAGLPANFALSVGDFFAFDWGSDPESRALHQVVEPVTADGSGTTANFEVRPAIRNPELVEISPQIAVTFKRPAARFTVMPGSIQTNEAGPFNTSISFQALQSI